jgi:hypothetical protein
LTHEQLRRSYRPKQVRLLFVGESPPASGKFFYCGNSGLYRAMREIFQRVNPDISDESFLTAFKSFGCYLVDLCPEPVDQLHAPERDAACRAAERALSNTIARMHPVAIVTIVRAIEGIVLDAASRANWSGTMIHVPYPGRWSRLKRTFVDTLSPVIAGLASR